jgi:hypothetical protein
LGTQNVSTLELVVRTFVAASALLAMLLLACGGDGGSTPTETIPSQATDPSDATEQPTRSAPVSPEERPGNVPPEATPVVQTEALGEIVRQANETPEISAGRVIASADCAENLLRIETSQETIYAVIPCDRFSEDQFAPFFIGKPAAIVLEVSNDRYRLLIETDEGATAEFTPDSIWVE